MNKSELIQPGKSLHWTSPPSLHTGTYQKEITISFDANGGSGDVPESQTTITYAIVSKNQCASFTHPSDAITLPEGSGLVRAGYTFSGWIKGRATGSYTPAGTVVKPTADTVYYAKWKPDTYAVTLHANGGSGGTGLTSLYLWNSKNTAHKLGKSRVYLCRLV